MTNDVDLIPIPFDSLRVGAIAHDNMYAHDSGRLLVKAGTVIDEKLLVRIYDLNGGKPTLYIVGLPMAPATMPFDEMDKRRRELEKSLKHDVTIEDTEKFLSNVTANRHVEPERVNTIWHSLQGRLDTTDTAIIIQLVNALAPVDEYLQRHCINTAFLNALMGRWMGLPDHAVSQLSLVGLLHDCGKALMPPSILNESSLLTTVEYEVIKTHPIQSYELLKNFPQDIRTAVRGHHEKMDGNGYPDRLIGDDIPIEARITSLSDIYDALVAQRSYKKAHSPFSVMALLKRLSGIELDARLVEVFLANMPKELIDKPVVLSDSTVAYVCEINLHNVEYPIVVQYGEKIQTNADLYCVSMY